MYISTSWLKVGLNMH